MAVLTPLQKLDFASFHEGYLSRYIAQADTKAAVALTVNAGLLGFIATRPELWAAAKVGGLSLAILLVNGLVAMIGGAYSLLTIMPRRSRSSEGLIFWRAVRAHADEAAYIAAIDATTPSELARARLSHSWALCGVAEKKYNHLFTALAWTALAVVATVGHLLISTLQTPAQTKDVEVTQPAAPPPAKNIAEPAPTGSTGVAPKPG